MSDAITRVSRPTGWRGLLSRASLAAARTCLPVSPRPMAFLLRREFARTAGARAAALRGRAPLDIVAVIDERYERHPAALLDVYVPASAARPGEKLPTVVWTHGGAFVGGSKDEIAYYLRLIASAGFAVVGVRYALAPEEIYPTPVRQLMAALRHLRINADRLHVDPTRLALGGDSAGAQISAELAALVTNPGYRAQVGVAPTVAPAHLRGVALCCGIFDLTGSGGVTDVKGLLRCISWAYSGRRDYLNDGYFISTMSVANHVTERFPATFITAGNADPLEPQSRALAATLASKGVDTETLFYPQDHRPALLHEYQFDLDLADGRAALQRLIAFFERSTRKVAVGATVRPE